MDAPTVSRPRHNRRGLLKSSALALLPLAIPLQIMHRCRARRSLPTSRLPSTTLVKAKLPGPGSYPERHGGGGVPLPLTDHEQRMF